MNMKSFLISIVPIICICMVSCDSNNSFFVDDNYGGNDEPQNNTKEVDIHGVWVSDDGLYVLQLNNDDSYTEYVLASRNAGMYVHKVRGYYSCTIRSEADGNAFGGMTFEDSGCRYQVDISNFNTLSLDEYINGRSFRMKRGSTSDIPTAYDIKNLLLNSSVWVAEDDDVHKVYIFSNQNKVEFDYWESIKSDSYYYNNVGLVATGTFSVSNNTVKCYFDSVAWDYYNKYPNAFPGWEYGESCTKELSIKVNGYDIITINSERYIGRYLDISTISQTY